MRKTRQRASEVATRVPPTKIEKQPEPANADLSAFEFSEEVFNAAGVKTVLYAESQAELDEKVDKFNGRDPLETKPLTYNGAISPKHCKRGAVSSAKSAKLRVNYGLLTAMLRKVLDDRHMIKALGISGHETMYKWENGVIPRSNSKRVLNELGCKHLEPEQLLRCGVKVLS